ncbi:carbohydrate kinase [Microbacterium sp. NPDC057944]|uniref:carbohydrate kinase family protein n=1 Tax=Microbacterium sp. NPDC057944 TaxID=3346286 RepID=UPI0036DC25C2
MSGAVVIGEALVDVLSGGEAHPGGSPLNVAVGLSRLGVPTTLFTRIGHDADGERIRRHLEASGVRLGAGSQVGPHSSTATVTVAADGRAEYRFDLVVELPVADIGDVDLVHAGSFSALLHPGAESVRAAFAASVDCLRSFDPNVRPDVMGEPGRALPLIEEFVRRSHIVKLSDEDAEWLYPDLPLVQVLERLSAQGAALSVVTRGAQGCLALSGGALVSRDALPVVPVDTIGAGDSFMSGLLDGVLGSPSLVAALRTGRTPGLDEVERVLDRALSSAAITVSRQGADPPWAEELRAATA